MEPAGVVRFIKLRIIAICILVFSAFILTGTAYGITTSLIERSSDVLLYLFSFVIGVMVCLYAVWMLLYAVSLEVSGKGIVLADYEGRHFLAWSEIEFLEKNTGTIIIGNKEKYLALPDFFFWTGENCGDVRKELSARLAKQGIGQPVITVRAMIPRKKGFQTADKG